MKNRFLFIAVGFAAALSIAASLPVIRNNTNGLLIGLAVADKIAFHGSAPVAQRSGANGTALTDNTGGSVADAVLAVVTAPTALTDSTTGTPGTTLAAGTGDQTIAIPIQLASMTTAAADLITAYTPGFRFKVLGISFATTTLGTGTSASQVLNLAISGTPVTGGVTTLTLATTTPLGNLIAGTAVTAANVGTASDTLSLKVATSGTVFTAGAGVLLVKLQNMDTADAVASANARQIENRAAVVSLTNAAAKNAELANELRATFVELGLHKGS